MNVIAGLIIGDSKAMQHLREDILRFAPTQLPILIHGPTGSGKELVARGLHAASRRSGSLVAFNVCALSESMFEDALFGHVRGAFTGAVADRPGYLAEANGGTIFLDEIGGTQPSAQAKLLRAVETGSFRPVGAVRDRISDFRVVSAVNEPLQLLAERGTFRLDLLHRLAGVVLEVPPLSAHREDISQLAVHFLDALRVDSHLSRRALCCLEEYDWPGNVRELKHTVERATVLSGSPSIEREDVEQAIQRPEARPDTLSLDNSERRKLLRALLAANWNVPEVARNLGVHRATIYRRMRQFRLNSHEAASCREMIPFAGELA